MVTCWVGSGYAVLGSSRQLAIGPTSAISLMIAGTVGEKAGGDAQRYAQIASLAGFTVAVLCLIAWLLRLSVLVKLISDSILVGFKAGAGLTTAMTQHELHAELAAHGAELRVVGAHGSVRDLLRADGLSEKSEGLTGPRRSTVCSAVARRSGSLSQVQYFSDTKCRPFKVA